MRIIVFDEELHEPLTIVEIPHDLARMGMDGVPVRLLAPMDFDSGWAPPTSPFLTEKVVQLRFERVCRGNARNVLFWFAYADDPETALLLRAAFLPGQAGEVQRRQRHAWLEGALSMAFDRPIER